MSDDLAELAARGLAQQRAGQHKAAIQIYRMVLKRGGGDARLLVWLGECYEVVGDAGQADDSYCTAIERDPDFFLAYLRAADLALRARGVAESRGEAAAAEEFRRGAYSHLAVLGARLMGRGGWRDAEAVLRRALELAPGEWAPHVDLGRCLLEQNRLGEAEAELREGLRLAPGEARAHFHFGALARRAGRAAEAAAALREALRLDPGLAAAADELKALDPP